MTKSRTPSFTDLLVLVFIALIAIFTQIPVDYLPFADGNLDSRCEVGQRLERRAEASCWNVGSLSTDPQRAYDYNMKRIEDYAASSNDSITANEATFDICSILESELVPVDDLYTIVNHPRLNSLAVDAIHWSLFPDIQRVYDSEPAIECHSGRPTMYTIYQIILNRQNWTVMNECLKLANILVNAPFGRWAEELSHGYFEGTINAYGMQHLSSYDLYYCKDVFRYVRYIVDKMENQGLAETEQYRRLAGLRAHLQRFFGETQG